MTQPQVESYIELKENNGLTEKRKEIYDVLLRIGPCTWSKIGEYTGKPTNEVTSRIRELVDIGWAIECGTEFNEKTGRDNTVYKALTTQGPKKVKGYKNTGVYVNANDVDRILGYEDVVSKDYSVYFKNRVATVTFNKIRLIMNDVNNIFPTNNGLLVFINPSTVLKAPIITRLAKNELKKD